VAGLVGVLGHGIQDERNPVPNNFGQGRRVLEDRRLPARPQEILADGDPLLDREPRLQQFVLRPLSD
jgi:hypothetical protein